MDPFRLWIALVMATLVRQVLNSVAAFAESIELSFQKAAGGATFKFVSHIVDLGISTQHNILPTAGAADVLDRFSIATLQWFLNAARANPIIAPIIFRDAPLIVACSSRLPIIASAPSIIIASAPRRLETGTGKSTGRESATQMKSEMGERIEKGRAERMTGSIDGDFARGDSVFFC
jgi:hypothetical protein